MLRLDFYHGILKMRLIELEKVAEVCARGIVKLSRVNVAEPIELIWVLVGEIFIYAARYD